MRKLICVIIVIIMLLFSIVTTVLSAYKEEIWGIIEFKGDEEPQYLYTDDAILNRLDDALRTVENIFN